MKHSLIILSFLFLFSSCSVMQKQMVKKMSRMTEDEKIEMMSKMMNSGDSTTCNDMMQRMSAVFPNDSLSKKDMASQMLPLCVGGILEEVDDEEKSAFLLNLTKDILGSGYDNLPDSDKEEFKKELSLFLEKL